jgi:mRNA interferase MazF
MVEQYGVYWVELDPVQGGEMAKTRPCVVVSPADLNTWLGTVIVAPVTSTLRNYPYRIHCTLQGRDGEIAADQIRTVDKSRLKRKVGKLTDAESGQLQDVFYQMLCR